MDENSETFVAHVIFIALISVHPDIKAQIAPLLTKEVTILDKYSDFDDVFFGRESFGAAGANYVQSACNQARKR